MSCPETGPLHCPEGQPEDPEEAQSAIPHSQGPREARRRHLRRQRSAREHADHSLNLTPQVCNAEMLQ